MNKDTIYHHGILGMRWGKKNGPPYPLSPGDHSASEKKAGRRKSLGGGSTASYKAKKKQAKIDRNARDRKIQEEYDRTEASIEKKYKRGQPLSDKDYARELEADNKARDAWKKSKEQYRQDINNAKKNKKLDAQWEKKVRRQENDPLPNLDVYNKASEGFNSRIESINKKYPGDKLINGDFDTLTEVGKKYYEEVTKMYNEELQKAADYLYGENASGTKKVKAYVNKWSDWPIVEIVETKKG